MYAPLALGSPVGGFFTPFLSLVNRKRKILLLVPRHTTDTLSTSVLNDPSFTTHDLLRLLWQSSPNSDILTQFTYSLTSLTLTSFVIQFVYICQVPNLINYQLETVIDTVYSWITKNSLLIACQ
jgi:hypothetical protein